MEPAQPARTMPGRLGCLLAVIIVTVSSASTAAAVSKEHDPLPAGMPSTLQTMPAPTTTGTDFGTCNGTHGAPVIYTQDRFLDEATRQSLIAYLDSATPTNHLDIVMVPTPTSLFRKFHATLDGLGRRSSSVSRFPGFQEKDYQSGEGRFPGKLSLAGDKQCHIDYEVDTDFEVDNIVGPTDGRVGILYLAGEGEFAVVNEETKEEHRVEVSWEAGRGAHACVIFYVGFWACLLACLLILLSICVYNAQIKPGRFISWDNKAHKHCVLTASGEPRRFLGPVVLDAEGTGLIPVVDILTVRALWLAVFCGDVDIHLNHAWHF